MNFSFQSIVLLALFLFMVARGEVTAQSIEKQKMQQLNFMIGEWVGTSVSIENGIEVKSVPAYQKITYQLDSHIIVIDLHSSTLQLHTVIRYSQEDSNYIYQPFSKNGTKPLPAFLTNGKLVVESNATTRYVFGKYGENGFREYGEKQLNGEWTRYFEDTFENTN